MINLLSSNPQVKVLVESTVISAGAVSGADYLSILTIHINPILQAVSLLCTIVLTSVIIFQRCKAPTKED